MTGPKGQNPSPPPLPADEGVEYRSRTSALDREERLRLEGDQLVILPKEGPTLVLPLASLYEICLRFFPTRFQANRYECLLLFQNGRRMKVCSQFFAGMADFEDQSASYRKWVEELHRRTALANSACHYRSGVGMVRYILNAALLIGVALLLISVMIMVAFNVPAIAIIKLVIIAFYIPVVIRWLRRNVPATYSPDAIPSQVLPR